MRGSVLVDGLTIGDVGQSILRDRKHLSDDGVLVATVILDKQSGAVLNGPDLTQRGFLHQPNNEELMKTLSQKVQDKLDDLRNGARSDSQGVARIIRDTLSDHIWNSVRRRPMILPVVLEV